MYLSGLSFKERMLVSKVADLYRTLTSIERNDYWAREFTYIRRFAKFGLLDRNEMETIITAMESLDEKFDKLLYYKSDLKLKDVHIVLPKMKAILNRYYAKKGIKKEG